jgi:hypothetical protein
MVLMAFSLVCSGAELEGKALQKVKDGQECTFHSECSSNICDKGNKKHGSKCVRCAKCLHKKKHCGRVAVKKCKADRYGRSIEPHHSREEWDKVFEKTQLWSPKRLTHILHEKKKKNQRRVINHLAGGNAVSLLPTHSAVYQISQQQQEYWHAWRMPGSSAKSREFNVGEPPDSGRGSGPDFFAFILFNPASDLASDMEEMCRIWTSWVRPGVINVFLALPAEERDLKLPERCKRGGVKTLLVPEKAGYPPVKLVLAMWKHVHETLHSQFTSKVCMFGVRSLFRLSSRILHHIPV